MIEFTPDEVFQVRGRGTVFTADRTKQPQVDNIKCGDRVYCSGRVYTVTGIEYTSYLTSPPIPGRVLGFVVKEY